MKEDSVIETLKIKSSVNIDIENNEEFERIK
jgi:hypothetical protein